MRQNLRPELPHGLFHLLVVPVCSPSTQSVTILLGVFAETVQFES